MLARISPRRLAGSFTPPASKSCLIRLILCAALCSEKTYIEGRSDALDVGAALRCARALGASVETTDGGFAVTGGAERAARVFDCGESAAVLRMCLPIAAATGGGKFTGEGRLPQRPVLSLLRELERAGCSMSSYRLPFEITGSLRGGLLTVDCSESSQPASGFLLALPLVGGELELEGARVSAGYLDMTAAAMDRFGVSTERRGARFCTRGGYRSPGTVSAEPDWSCAAALLAANELGGKVSAEGLDWRSQQPDRAVLSLGGIMAGGQVNFADFPDLFPLAAVLAAGRVGETRLFGAKRLRGKESDRIASAAALIRSLGGEVGEFDDGLTIRGKGSLKGGNADGAGDHRIVMAAALASCICGDTVTVTCAESASKSWPSFWEEFGALGGNVELV